MAKARAERVVVDLMFDGGSWFGIDAMLLDRQDGVDESKDANSLTTIDTHQIYIYLLHHAVP
jgi:hypothetical protein